MNAWSLSVGLVAFWLGPADPAATPEPRTAVIEKAVRDLGHPRFSVRRQASQTLWEQGLAAEPALKQAAERPDREVRSRAQAILNDFRYGILPGVPGDVAALMRQFRDGNPTERQAALQTLAQREEFERLERLLGLEPDAAMRRQWLVVLIQQPRALDKFLDPDRLERLISAVAADQDEVWRRTVLAQLLFSPAVLQRLADGGRLDAVVKVINREKSVETRRQMLSLLFQNPQAVSALLEKDHLSLALQLIEKDPDRKTRSGWIGTMLSGAEAIKRLAQDERLERLLKFAQDNAEPADRGQVILRLFQNGPVVEAILAQRGLDRLVELSRIESDPVQRGQLLASLMSSPGIQMHIQRTERRELLIQLAAKLKDRATRGAYLKAVLAGGNLYFLLQNPDGRRTLWELIRSDTPPAGQPPQDWCGDTALQMLSYQGADSWLREEEHCAWFLEFLRIGVTLDQRARLLRRILEDQRLQTLVKTQERIEILVALAKEVPTAARGPLLGRLAMAEPLMAAVVSRKREDLLLTLAREEADRAVRQHFLEGLFHSETLMAALQARGASDELWTWVQAESDPIRRAGLRADFASTPSAMRQLTEKNEVDALVRFAQEQTDPAVRQCYLQRLFRNYYALSVLVDKGHFDTLFALANQTPERPDRVALLSILCGHSVVIRRLIERKQAATLLGLAGELSEERVARPRATEPLCPYCDVGQQERSLSTFLQQLLADANQVNAMLDQGHLDALLALCQRSKERYQRVYQVGQLLAAPKAIEHFATAEHWSSLVTLLGKEPDETREQLYQRLLQQPATIKVLVEKNRLDDVLNLLQNDPKPDRRGRWLALVLGQGPVLSHLTSQKRLDRIVELARAQTVKESRWTFLQTLFANPAAIAAFAAAGRFDEVLQLAQLVAEPPQRAVVLGQLFANPQTIEYLAAQKRVPLLLQVAREWEDAQVRRQFLTMVVASPPAVAALIAHEQFEALFQLCRAEPDPQPSRRMASELLLSGQAVAHLARTGRLTAIVREVLDEPDTNHRRNFYQRWLSRADALNAAVEHGQFDVLYEAAEASSGPEFRRQWLGNLFAAEKAVVYLATRGKGEALLKLLTDDAEPWRLQNNLENLLRYPAALQALLAGGHYDALRKLLDRDTSNSAYTLSRFLFHPMTIEYLDKHNRLERLSEEFKKHDDLQTRQMFLQKLVYEETGPRLLSQAKLGRLLLEMIQAESDQNRRRMYAQNVLNNARIVQALVDGDQSDVLRELAKLEPETQARSATLRRLLDSPTGAIARHLRRGEHPQALRLLEEHADDDVGRVRLAAYLAVRGQLAPRIAEVKQQAAPALSAGAAVPSEAAVNAARLLAYLYRAQGDLREATEAARATRDQGLLKALLVERRDWAEAARLQAAGPCPLPIPGGQIPSNRRADYERIEQLGLLASYQRLAGQEVICQQTLDEIERLDETAGEEKLLRWSCVEALALNGRVDAALKILAAAYPANAFDWYCLRHQFGEALALGHWRDDLLPDRAWLETLPADGPQPAQKLLQQFQFALKIAKTLRTLGRGQAADRLVDWLERVAGELPADDQSRDSRRQCHELLCIALLGLGDEDRAWEIGARAALPDDYVHPLLHRLYPQQVVEANAWDGWYRAQQPSDGAAVRLRKIHHMLRRSSSTDLAVLRNPSPPVSDAGDPFGAPLSRPPLSFGLVHTCLRHKEYALAHECFARLGTVDRTSRPVLAELLWCEQKWLEAAEQYAAVWEDDHEQLTALYLSGESLRRGGREDEGRQRKDQASLLALEGRARLNLALGLLRSELRDEATAQLQLVLRTAALEAWEWNDAVRHLGDLAARDRPAEAADWLEHSALDDLRPWFSMLDSRDYVKLPGTIQLLRARAAIAAGQFADVERAAERALAAVPGDIRVAEELVPLLEQAGRPEQAEALFQKLHGQIAPWSAAYPDSALLHNQLAWLCARCGRHLDEAQASAEKAVALEPKNGNYVDTLAEVYFQRGDRDTALRHSRHAMELSPHDKLLRRQFERFQQTPLPTQHKP